MANSMVDNLYNYFKKKIDYVYRSYGDMIVNLSCEFGEIRLGCDFFNREYIVESNMDIEQYCNMYMVAEDEVTDEQLYEWNSIDKYDNLVDALKKCQDLLDAYESENGNSDLFNLDDDKFFTNAIKIVKKV